MFSLWTFYLVDTHKSHDNNLNIHEWIWWNDSASAKMIPLVATTMILLKNEVEAIASRQVGLQGLVVWQHMVIM